MKSVFTVIGSSLVVLLVFSLFWTFPVSDNAFLNEAGVVAAAADGQQVFMDQKCNLCHAVSTVGIEATTKAAAMKGPDLVNISQDAEFIGKYLKKEADLEGEKHKKNFTGSDEELKALVDWILAQKQ